MSSEPLISIVIPAFNAERFLGEAIESVLSQDAGPLEIIVVDDGSTDRTAGIAAGYAPQVTLIRQANMGPPGARNQGLAAARGAFIGFCDADDVFLPGCLGLQLEKLCANPAVDLVVGRYANETMVSAPGEALAFAPMETSADYIMSMSVSLIRRHVFDRVGNFDAEMRQCDDWDWFMRARELQVPILLHPAILMRRRLHDSNITRDQQASQRYTALMLKRSLDRRRRGAAAAQSLASLASQAEAGSAPDQAR